MAKASLKALSNGIEDHLNAMLKRDKAMQSYLARNVYRQYQKAQIERWKTQNESQTGMWLPPQNAAYIARKKRLYGAARGSKTLYASGRLFGSVAGRGELGTNEHRVMVTPKRLSISTATPYAKYAAEDRPFMEFNRETEREWAEGIRDFLVKGIGQQIGGLTR